MDPVDSQEAQSSMIHHPGASEACCILCRRFVEEDVENMEGVEGYETLFLCQSCKVLFQDTHPDMQPPRWRRHNRRRSRSHQSLGSADDVFSHQFLQLISQMRQNFQNVSASLLEHGYLQDVDVSSNVRLDGSPYTVYDRHGRRRRAHSDSESDMDSLFGESDTNVSVSGYGAFPAESDALSFSGYMLHSDASLDRQSLVDREMFLQWDEEGHVDSDTDIDPMHAGCYLWNSDDEEEEEDENGEWVEVDGEGEAVEETDHWTRGGTSTDQRNEHSDWEQGGHDSRYIVGRYRNGFISDVFMDLARTEVRRFLDNPNNYLDESGFADLLDRLTNNDPLVLGAPPAAESVVSSLPLVVISDEHEEQGVVMCAICKDPLVRGTRVNQLPCMHLYHPPCILPWLSARNSCPICRYELLTDDKHYEEEKQIARSRLAPNELRPLNASEESSSDSADDTDGNEQHNSEWLVRVGELQIIDNDVYEQLGGYLRVQRSEEQANTSDEGCTSDGIATNQQDRTSRRRWFFLTAAPIVSIMGMVLVLWLGNPLIESRLDGSFRQQNPPTQPNGSSGRSAVILNGQNRTRNWWSL